MCVALVTVVIEWGWTTASVCKQTRPQQLWRLHVRRCPTTSTFLRSPRFFTRFFVCGEEHDPRRNTKRCPIACHDHRTPPWRAVQCGTTRHHRVALLVLGCLLHHFWMDTIKQSRCSIKAEVVRHRAQSFASFQAKTFTLLRILAWPSWSDIYLSHCTASQFSLN